MISRSRIPRTGPIRIRIDGRDTNLSLAEAKALQAGLNRAIAKVERFKHGVKGLIRRGVLGQGQWGRGVDHLCPPVTTQEGALMVARKQQEERRFLPGLTAEVSAPEIG